MAGYLFEETQLFFHYYPPVEKHEPQVAILEI